MSRSRAVYHYSNTAIVLSFTFLFWILAAWMTHIIVTIKAAEWLFLIAGALFVPIAWVHGTGVWFNFW